MIQLTQGQTAPPFSLQGIDGHSYEFTAKKIPLCLLTFFKNTCPTCQLSVPYLEKIYKYYSEKGLTLWGIEQDHPEQSRQFGKDYRLTFPILPDVKPYPVSNAYGISVVPTVFLVDFSGQVIFTSTAFVKKELSALSEEIGRRLNTAPLTVFAPGDTAPPIKPG